MSALVDCRCRPVALDPFYGGEGVAPERLARLEWMNRRVGADEPTHFQRFSSDDALAGALQDAGIVAAVVIGRRVPGIMVDNARVAEWDRRPRWIGVGAVEVGLPVKRMLAEVEEIAGLGLSGVNLDPGMSVPALRADARELFPVYDACAAAGLPVFLMSGPNAGPTLEYTRPDAFGKVASTFPELKLVIGHGAWPFVEEMLGVAFRYENVFLCPDIYLGLTGSDAFVRAARSDFLRQQLVFASGFPFRGIAQTADEFRGYDWGAAFDDVCWANAVRLFGRENLSDLVGAPV
jgi:predicted TIM-barrel fold metal-dependent hydrolase